ncbi:MAG: guanylate kinase [Cyanobacteria bacterium NC_groundwater_1444_Ag_S-0.65um_54_12]|nr:guanylate kinase [Cyanobacteria bacterium NC_groundwater_1444_Ag_S-0.65um_54_12]
MLIVISGPSGVGKGTLVKELIRRQPELLLSISVTTRAPRPGEQEGIDYFFRSEEEFMELVASDALLEYTQFVNGLYYGTPRTFVEETIKQGRDLVLEIDVKGAIQVKERWPQGVYIFLLPPTMAELQVRLAKRQTEAAEAIRQRLSVAVDELNLLPLYDYQVVNDDLATATAKLAAIWQAERCRVSRQLAHY